MATTYDVRQACYRALAFARAQKKDLYLFSGDTASTHSSFRMTGWILSETPREGSNVRVSLSGIATQILWDSAQEQTTVIREALISRSGLTLPLGGVTNLEGQNLSDRMNSWRLMVADFRN